MFLIMLKDILVIYIRTLKVPESCNGVARFNFNYLCGRPVLFLPLYEFIILFSLLLLFLDMYSLNHKAFAFKANDMLTL